MTFFFIKKLSHLNDINLLFFCCFSLQKYQKFLVSKSIKEIYIGRLYRVKILHHFFSIKTQNKNYIITSSISKENSFNKSIFLLLQLSTLPNQFHRKMQIKNKKQQQKKQKSIQLQSINSQQQKQKIFFDRMTALTDFFYWIFSYLKIVFFLSVLCSNYTNQNVNRISFDSTKKLPSSPL